MNIICLLVGSILLAAAAGSEDSYKKCVCQKSSACFCVKENTCLDGNFRLNTTRDGCSEDEVCCANFNKKGGRVFGPRRTRQRKAMCGVRGTVSNTQREKNETEAGEFPWMLALFTEKDSKWTYHCGASLIGKNIALTAGHCVDKYLENPGALKIRADVWNMENNGYQESQAAKIILHPEYSANPIENDLALIVTQTNFRRNPRIGTICIPPKGFKLPQGTKCIATGWGKSKSGPNNPINTTLKKVELPLVSHDVCQNNLRNTLLGAFFYLHDSFMCAGGKQGADTCEGDGGSPLVCSHQGYYYQTGIVAWGIGCGDKNIPGVYTNVALFRDWIKETYKMNS